MSHYGFKQSDVLRSMHGALEEGRKGNFLPEGYKMGISIVANDVSFRGRRLERKSRGRKK